MASRENMIITIATLFKGYQKLAVVVDLGFTTLLTSQVIGVAFYSEHENPTNFAQRL